MEYVEDLDTSFRVGSVEDGRHDVLEEGDEVLAKGRGDASPRLEDEVALGIVRIHVRRLDLL